MTKGTQNSEDAMPKALENWLKTQPVVCSKDFRERLRQKLTSPSLEIDSALDDLFRLRPELHDPEMILKVRQKLDREMPGQTIPVWSRWLRPLAAAAMLGLTFWGFQQSHSVKVLQNADTPIRNSATLQTSDDLEMIFALASTMELDTEWVHLEASDNWAFLID